MSRETNQADESTRQEYRDYLARWQAVNEFTDSEYRNKPVVDRIRDFFHLMEQAKSMGWKTTDEAEVEEVRDRWRRLREASNE